MEEMSGAIVRNGYAIAREYRRLALQVIRLFLMYGVCLQNRGGFVAFRRVPSRKNLRINMRAGGKSRPAELTDTMFSQAEMVRLRQVEDGMFSIGLDIIRDRLMGINVCSSDGLGRQDVRQVEYTRDVIHVPESRLQNLKFYCGFSAVHGWRCFSRYRSQIMQAPLQTE